MPEIEQAMRKLKLGGMAKNWRSVDYRDKEQYVSELLELELREREAKSPLLHRRRTCQPADGEECQKPPQPLHGDPEKDGFARH